VTFPSQNGGGGGGTSITPASSTPQPGRFRTLLVRKELPFLLAGLAAVLCWLLSHITSRLLDARLIEYSSERTDRKDGSEVIVYTIKNLTRSAVFTDLNFTLDVEGDGSILGNPEHKYKTNTPVAPLPEFLPDSAVEKAGLTANLSNDTTLQCHIAQLHPQRRATLTLFVTSGTQVPLRFQIKTGEAKGDVLPVLFEERSFWTRIVEYEFELALGLAAFIALAILIYAFLLSRTREPIQAAP
jgi:hypothetical protein